MGSGFSTPHDSTINISTSDQNIEPQQLDHYTSYDELTNILQETSQNHNKITRLYDNLGSTHEGRIIWMMKISDNPNKEEDETEVLFVGAHHGNELIGNEVAISIILTLTDGYGHDPRITWLVNNHEIWVVPMLNPDGTVYTFEVESWRKNRSPNYVTEKLPGSIGPGIYPTSYGTDLNRNYDYYWGELGGSGEMPRSSTYEGSEAFSELETNAMRDLILSHNFSVYIDYHSGIELILYPWGYTNDPAPDKPIFDQIGKVFTEMCGFETIQGYDLYQTNGDSIDWIYASKGTIAYTIELSNQYRPEEPEVKKILETQIKLPLYLAGISSNPETGSMLNITTEDIGNQSDLGPYPVTANVQGIPSFTDLQVKLYYKINDESWETVIMENTPEQPSIYTGDIPTQGPYSDIQYFAAITDGNIIRSSPDAPHLFSFTIEPSPGSIPVDEEIVAMIIMMIIILGFFWGGFAYAARLALLAERRKLHDYYYGQD
jgi:hypothetical protein